MKFTCMVISVADINAARKFYENLFGLEVFQDFDAFLDKLSKYSNIERLGEVIEHSWGQRVVRFYDLDGHIIEVGEDMKMVIKRFLATGMTMEEVSVKMDVSVEDLTRLLNS